jgi:hypothetical protein
MKHEVRELKPLDHWSLQINPGEHVAGDCVGDQRLFRERGERPDLPEQTEAIEHPDRCAARSISRTGSPVLASARAAAIPPMPPPTITTSSFIRTFAPPGHCSVYGLYAEDGTSARMSAAAPPRPDEGDGCKLGDERIATRQA